MPIQQRADLNIKLEQQRRLLIAMQSPSIVLNEHEIVLTMSRFDELYMCCTQNNHDNL